MVVDGERDAHRAHGQPELDGQDRHQPDVVHRREVDVAQRHDPQRQRHERDDHRSDLGSAAARRADDVAERRDQQPGDQRAAAPRRSRVVVQRAERGAREPAGQRPPYVIPFALQGDVGARQTGDRCLRKTFGEATRAVVAPRAAFCRYDVSHDRGRLVDDPRAGQLPGTDAQLGLLAAHRPRSDPSKLALEPAEVAQNRRAEGHARADDVAHRRGILGQPQVAAPDDPVELAREPRWPGRLPAGLDPAPDRDYAGVGVRREQLTEPLDIGCGRVVVEEDDDVTTGGGHAGVAGAGQTLGASVGHHANAVDLGLDPTQQRRAVIDDDDGLQRRRHLPPGRGHRLHELVPALLGEATDHDGSAEPGRSLHAVVAVFRPGRCDAAHRGAGPRRTQDVCTPRYR